MLDFINKIYNSEYFIIGLLIFIAILTVIFIALIVSGKKSKKNKEAEDSSQSLEQNLQTINNVASSEIAVSNTPQVSNINQQVDIPMPSVAPTPAVQPAVAENAMETPVPEPNNVSVNGIPQNINVVSQEIPETPQDVVNNPVVSENDQMYNTSIFRSAPIDLTASESSDVEPANLSNVSIGQKIENKQEDITNGLFEPAPDLSAVAIENSVDTPAPVEQPVPVESVSPVTEAPVELPNLNNPAISIPVEQSVTNPEVAKPAEKIQMPNQFSSVYINKEQPKVETTIATTESNMPSYDQSSFTSVANPTPVQEPVNVESNPVTDFSSTKSILDNLNAMSTSMNEPKDVSTMPNIKTAPTLEPINHNSINDNSEVNINPANTFNYDLPNAAAANDVNTSQNNSGNSFPQFNPETYNINNQ